MADFDLRPPHAVRRHMPAEVEGRFEELEVRGDRFHQADPDGGPASAERASH